MFCLSSLKSIASKSAGSRRSLWLAALLGCSALVAVTDAHAIDVANQTDWNTAVAAVAAAGTGTTTTINITAGFTLSSSLAQLQAANTGVIVNITGNAQAIDGASSFQGIQVNGANALTVNISDLSVTNTKAAGGSGANGQNGYYSGGLSYGSGGGGGGGLGAGGGLLVGSGANVTLSSVTFTGSSATGGTGGTGGSAQNAAADPVNGGNGGAGGATNNGGASGGGGAGGTGGHAGGQGTTGTTGAAPGDGGGGGGGSGTTGSTVYTTNNSGGSGNANGGNGGAGGDGVTNNNGSQGPGSDGGYGGSGGGAPGGAIYVATGGTLTILDTPIGGAVATGGVGGNAGVGAGPSAFNGAAGGAGTGSGAAIYLSGVMANIGVSGGTVTYANTIGGTGLTTSGVNTALNKTGAGTLVLAATNTFIGNVNISAGTVSISSTGNLGASNNGVFILDGGALAVTATTTLAAARAFKIAGFSTIDVANGTTTTLQGVIGNGASTGALVKEGDGTLLLSAANTYGGSTTVNGGTLRAGNASALPSGSAFTVASTALLDLNGFNSATGSLAGAGTVTNGGAAAITLTAGSNGTSTVFSGVIQDGVGAIALTKSGAGNLNLSGANSFTGATIVNAGTLSVNGSTATSSMTTVNAGGALGGNGTVGNTTINGGALAPGNSIGTLNVQGSLSFTAASTYMVQISPAAADRTNVTGVATLGGATVNASFEPGSYVAKQYVIVNSIGGVSGTFGALVNSNLPASFSSNLSYDANNVFLNLTMGSSASLNVNQTNASNALAGYFNRSGGIPAVFATLTPAGLTQVSGELGAGSQQTTFDAMNMFMGVLSDPSVEGRSGPSTASAGPSAYAADSDLARAYGGRELSGSERDAHAMITKAAPLTAGFDARWSVWAAAFGGSQTTDGSASAGSSSATSRVYGTAVGADYRFSLQTIAGFALAGGGSNFSVANGLGSGRSDLFQAGAFVKHHVGPAYILGALAYGWQDVTTDRVLAISGDRLRANFNANSYSGRVEAGYRYLTPWMGVGLTPYAAGQFTTFDMPGYAEGFQAPANTFALNYGAKSVTASRSELGLRSDKSFAARETMVTLRGRAAWAHDYNIDRNVTATFQTLPGATFVVNGATPARDAALTTASVEVKWHNGMSVAGTFDGEFSQLTRSYAGKGVVRYSW